MTSFSEPSIGLIGCGRWGRNLARVLARLGALKVIADPAGEALRPYADELGVALAPDTRALFEDAAIRGVVIAAPAVDHASLIREALGAGKHVFVEKPLALDMDDALAVAHEAEQRSLTLMVGHLLQYHPAFRKLLEEVRAGAIGAVRHIVSNRLNPGAIRNEENALWSMGPHDFSMILALAGRDPVSVQAMASTVVQPQIPDQFSVAMRFSDDLTAQANLSWISPYKEHRLTVLGERGALVFEDTAPDPARKLVLYPDYVDLSASPPRFRKSPGTALEFANEEPLQAEMEHFLACMAGRVTPRTGPAEAIPVLRLLQTAQAASEHTLTPIHGLN